MIRAEPQIRPASCPEWDFVLQATLWPHDAPTVAAFQNAARRIRDPQRLLALINRHHVHGLAARAFAHCDGLIEDSVREAVRRQGMALAEEQFRQFLQTAKAVKALQAHDISVAVLKGSPAAMTIFGEPVLRSSVDIDLLIDRADLEQAAAILSTIGYARSEPPLDASERHVRNATFYGKDWGFDYVESDTGIELHWRLFMNPHLMPHVHVRDAVPVTCSGAITLPVLPLETSIVFMIAHGAEHAWERLKWLADLATVLRRNLITPNRLMARARDFDLAHVTAAALLLSHECYNTALPSPAFSGIMRAWRTQTLLQIARQCLYGALDGAELTHMRGATTRKNLSHYLFSSSPRFLFKEVMYDLFHDAKDSTMAHISGTLLPRLGHLIGWDGKKPLFKKAA